jgi:SAM-dependent methyltransferase
MTDHAPENSPGSSQQPTAGRTPDQAANPANAPSARFFAGLGITAGMRVLDVGCGNGDLSRFVAALAGPDGEVVGIDRNEASLTAARGVEANPSDAPIVYRSADLTGELPDLGRFDAIVGRRVLMYLPDASKTIAHLGALAKPGAIMAFQEHARCGLPAGLGPLVLHRRLYDWMWNTVAAEGGDVGLALRLTELIQAAGFSIESANSEGILLRPGEPPFLPTLARVMLPRMVERGVLKPEDIDLDTLADEMENERTAAAGLIVWDLAVLVSARKD